MTRLLSIFAAALLLAAPCAAQVKVDPDADLNYLTPHWIALSDGSQMTLLTAPDLNTSTLVRCWPEEGGFECLRAYENWVTGFEARGVEWFSREDLAGLILATPSNKGCSVILDRISDDGTVEGCESLIIAMHRGGLLALARTPRASLADAS
jgi:hypothetical protein